MVSVCPIDPKTTSWLATKPIDDFRLGEVRGCCLGELHHEHRARREVRSVEQACPGRRKRGEFGELLIGEPRRADDAIDAGGQRAAKVSLDDARLREIDDDVEPAGSHGLLHRGVDRE